MSKYQSKHNNYELGTQAMLDAAKEDATKLPFNVVFITRYVEGISQSLMPNGIEVVRMDTRYCDTHSVAFSEVGGEDYWFCDYLSLLPAKKDKKPKQKKWQNGTQEQLDAAMENAKLIPKKTYFMSKYGTTKGKVVYRIDHFLNDNSSVYMFCDQDQSCDFHGAYCLGVIDE